MRVIILIIAMALSSGCSTIVAKTDTGFGHKYNGIELAGTNAFCYNAMAFVLFPPLVVATIPIGILDIATSGVVDTVLYPIDHLIDKDQNERSESKLSCFTF